jgi:GH25 family lysozyme M1 (1,4-beta-N-acetylmuramidase)
MKMYWPVRLILFAVFQLIAELAVAQTRPMGTDVSSFQPSINWPALRTDGISFAWTKATEGTYYQDAYFASHETGAVAAGVLIGAYHFARPSDDPNITGANSADTEAQYFWSFASNYVQAGGNYLVPMLDWEDPGVTNTSLHFTAAVLSAWANEWCMDVSNYARANGVILQPVIYTGTWYSNPANGYPGLTTAVTNWPAWLAAYPDCTGNACGSPTPQTSAPGGTYPWTTWNIWQYGDTNWSGGDSDVFNGTTNQFLQLFLVGSTNAPHILTAPATMTVAQASNVTLSASASGGTPLYYRWQFNGTTVASMTNFNTSAAQFTITNAQVTNAGVYTVQISNAYGTVITTPAVLSVVAPWVNAPGAVVAPGGLVDLWTGNGNTIDIVSGQNAVPANGFTYAAGQAGMAFHFDGSTSYLTVTNSPASIAVPWTACVWVYRQQTPQTSAALISDGTNTLKLEQYDNTHDVGMTELSVEDWSFSPAYSVPLNTWTHLAFVASGSTTSLYVNGVAEGTISAAIPLGRKTLGATDVTGTGYVDYLEGSMSQFLLFNKALSAGQIQSIYNAGAAGLVEAPQFLGISPDGNGNLVYSMEGLTGAKTYVVDFSTNLINWSLLLNISAETGTAQFTITPTNSATFYRLIQQY